MKNLDAFLDYGWRVCMALLLALALTMAAMFTLGAGESKA